MIERAAGMFDRVTVVIAVNTQKVPLLSEHERLELARQSLEHLPNVAVELFHGLTVEYALPAQRYRNHSRSACCFGFRVRVPNGADEPEARTLSDDNLHDATRTLHVPQFQHRA